MTTTTLRQIRQHGPCREGWRTLLSALGKTKADDEPLPLVTILQSNGLDDALWCLRTLEGHDKEIIQFALACAQEVSHLMTDQRSLDALDAVERHLESPLSKQELDKVLAVAWAVRAAARAAESAGAAAEAAEAVARAARAAEAAEASAWAAEIAARAVEAAEASARAAEAAEVVARAAARAVVGVAAEASEAAARAARAAAWAAARARQAQIFERIFGCPEGQTMVFRPKSIDLHEILQELSDRIRAIGGV